MSIDLLAAAGDQLPEDVGKSGPLGLLLTVLLLIAVVLLVRSMSKHLKRIPPSFDPADRPDVVPDTPAELMEQPPPGEHLLDTLRRAPRAIEPPRRTTTGRTRPGPRADPAGRRRVGLPAVGDVHDTRPRCRPPLRVKTRNGSRARTPRPKRGHALERPGLGDLPERREAAHVDQFTGLPG